MTKTCTILLFLLLTNILIFAQNEKSIHQIQSEYYSKNIDSTEQCLLKSTPFENDNSTLSISHKVYGFHPYWVTDVTAAGYYYSLLTHVAYFGAEVDGTTTTTGGFSTTHNWASTQVVNFCKLYNVKIHLCVIMFDNHSRVLANAAYRTNLVNNIIVQVNLRDADGVNIDFEAVAAAQRDNYRLFLYELGTALKANGKELTVCIPAVDWNGIYNTAFNNYTKNVIDYYFLMAYDYFYSGSTTAGPVSPLTTGTDSRHVTRSLKAYNSYGVPYSKIITGFGYYGYDWPVTSSTKMAATTGSASTKTFSQIKTTLSSIPEENKFFDATYNVPWYRYQSGSDWHQVWYEDSISISKKYDTLKVYGCGGTGMWALSYDGSNTDLWGALKKSFASTNNLSYSIISDFETSTGVFNNTPNYSGSNYGISHSSTAARNIGMANNGWSSLKVTLIDNSSSSDNWQVRFLSGGGNPSNNLLLHNYGYIGFWMKTKTASNSALVAVVLDDGSAMELSPKTSVINDGQWHLYEWNLQGSGWSSFLYGNGIINGPTATLDAIMFFAPNNSENWEIYMDDVAYNPNGPLPVELISFEGNLINNSVSLTWETATEINNYCFEIERNINNSIWEKIGVVQGNGNSSTINSYSFTDSKLSINGNYLYRLKQIDNDGNYKYLNTIEVVVGTPDKYELLQNYPNPFNPVTKINYTIPVSSQVNISIYSIIGELVKILVNDQQEAGNYTVDFDGSNLASGTYFYRITAGEFMQIKKMMLLK